MRPITISRTLAAAVANSIALLQTTGGAANLVLNGALVSAGVATIAAPSQITLTSTGNISGINFTITGTGIRGYAISEVLAGPNNNTVTSVNTYATITSIAVSGAVATNTSVGNAQAGASQVVPLDVYADPQSVTLAVDVTGTVNYTVQYTFDPVFVTTSLDALVWYNHSSLTGLTASQAASLVSPVTAVRLLTNSGGGTAVLRVLQAGGLGVA